MARIRTIKPEFWTSPQVAACSLGARLLFIGIWNFSDDGGRHPAASTRLKMEIFPGDDIDADEVAGWVAELCAAGLLARYTADGLDLLQVTGWTRHQRIDRPTFRFPAPAAGELDALPAPQGPPAPLDALPAPQGPPAALDAPPAPQGPPAGLDALPAPQGPPAALDAPPAPQGPPAGLDAPPAPQGPPAGLDEASTRPRRGLDEASPPEWNGKERKGNKSAAVPLGVTAKLPGRLADDQAFCAAWQRWRDHLVESGRRLTSQQWAELVAKLDRWGPQRAAEAIRATLAAGWVGIREDTRRGPVEASAAEAAARFRRELAAQLAHRQRLADQRRKTG